MKKMLIVLLVLIVSVSGIWGQTKFVPHQKGDRAIIFQFNGLNINSYRGGLGFKQFINENFAVRGMVDFYSAKEKYKWESDFSDTEGLIGEDGYDRWFGFGFEAAAEKHVNKGKIDPYYGAGVGFYMERNKYVEPVSGFQGGTLADPWTAKNTDAYTRFSVFGLFGLEYAINSMLSLAAEYQVLFAFTSYPDEVWDDGEGNEYTYVMGSYRYFGISTGGGLTLIIYLNR